MRLFQKKRAAVRWLNASFEKTESIRETVFRAALLLPAVLLILFSGVFMLRDVWSRFALQGSHAALLIAEVSACTALFGIFLPWLEGRLQGKVKEKWRKKIRLLVAAVGIYLLYMTASAVYWKSPLELEDGLLAIGNRFMDLYNADHRTSYVMDLGLIEFASYSGTYLLAIFVFLCFNLSYLTKKNGYWTVLPLLIWAAELAVGRAPYWASITLFGVGCYLLSGVGAPGKVGHILDGRGYPRQGGLKRRFRRKVVTAFLILGGMLLLSSVMRTPANHFVQSSRLADTVARWKEERYEGGEGARLEFDFFAEAAKVTNDEPRYRDAKILEVTVDGEPETNIYLKDFEGAVYQRGEWISRDAALRGRCINDDVDQRQIQHILNEEGYAAFSSNETDAYLYDRAISSLSYYHASPPNLQQYHIRYFRLERDTYPLPYFTDTGHMDEGDFAGDVLIKKSLFRRKISFSAPGRGTFSEADVRALSSRVIPEESEELWNWYDNYVKKQYLTVSQEIPSARRLAEALGGVNEYRNHARTNQERWQAAYQVSALLQRSDYSWDLEELEKGTDPVEYFLSTGKKGYCVHFASAGVMILRAMGVPTRYAEGYILKQQAFSEEEDGSFTAQALDRNRHAWAEIYLNHVGWIPIEMTKGYTSVSAVLQTQEEELRREQQSQNVSGNPQEMPTQSPAQSPEVEPGESSEEDPMESEAESKEEELWESTEPELELLPGQEDPSAQLPLQGGPVQGQGEGPGQYRPGMPGGTGEGKFVLWRILKILLWVCMAAATLLGTVRLIRGRIRAYYEAVDREFARGRYVSMVKRINRRLIAGLRRRRKIAKRYPTDAEYGATLIRQFPDVSEEGWKRYMDIVKEAAFSANGLDEEKAEHCREIYKKVRLFQRGV